MSGTTEGWSALSNPPQTYYIQNMLLSVGVYSGLLLAFGGIIGLLFPIRQLGTPTRAQGGGLLLAGLVMLIVSFGVPAREKRIAAVGSHLDDCVPRYQFAEFHQRRVNASPGVVYAALKEVTASEIRFFRVLTWIRRFGRSGEESILNAPADQPLIEVATRSGFRTLADQPGSELVIGTNVARGAFAAMNFRVTPDGNGSLITTETRIFASTAGARRRFTVYWRLIYPGSALIRLGWLGAIKKRAERA